MSNPMGFVGKGWVGIGVLGLALAGCQSPKDDGESGSVRSVGQRLVGSSAPEALFIVGEPILSPSDAAIRDRLTALGYDPIVVDDDSTATADANGRALIVISESSYSGAVGAKFRNVEVPVLSMEPVGWGHMDIAPTDASWGSTVGDAEDQVDLDIFPDGHLLSGYPGTSIRPNAFPQKYVWATLSSSDARVVATLVDQPEKATIFGYVKGTALEDGSRAPGRRVGFFAGRDAPELFTDQGWSSFDSAVRWLTFPKPGNAALLVVADIPLSAGDAAALERLETLGLGVEVRTDGTVTSAHAQGMRLVAISESVDSAEVHSKFRDVKVPLVSWEPGIWDDMGMAASSDPWDTNIGDETGQTQLVVSGSGALSAGLSGTITATNVGATYGWAKPSSPQVTLAATLAADPTKYALFGFDRGAVMQSGFLAPHRRVAFFAGPDAFTALSADGFRLFDAAVTWAIAPLALLVVDQQGSAAPADDAALAARLQGMGYTVLVRDGGNVQTADAAGFDLIVISESTVSSEVGTKFKNVAVPVINMEVALQDEFGMTSSSGQGTLTGQTEIDVVDPTHELAAGLDGLVTVATASSEIAWGSPTGSASVVATASGNAFQATVYGYEKGDAMLGLVAPAARVFLFPTRLSPTLLSDEGWSLFEAAVRWATGQAGPEQRLAFEEQPSGAIGASLAANAHTVQIAYTVNGGGLVSENLVRSGNSFFGTLAGGASFSAGDVIRATVSILSSSQGPSAFTQIYTVVGSHVTLAVAGRTAPILPYDTANPIVVGADESDEYLYATFSSPISAAEKALFATLGAHFDTLVSKSADFQAYRITALTAPNTLASALQSASSKFHNLTPLKLSEKIAPATEPLTSGNTKLVSITCGVQVPVANCQSAVTGQLSSVQHAYQRRFVGFATDAQIQALAAMPEVARGHEVPRALSTMAQARVVTNVEVLHQSLTLPYDPSQSRSGGGILLGIYDSGVDPGHPDFFDLSTIPTELRQEPGSTWFPPENVYKSLTSVPPFWDNHGTHVAGIAAGNGSHGGQVNRGVAVAATLFTAPSEYVGVFTHGNVINHSNIASRVSYYTESDAGEDLALDQPWLYEDGIYKTLVVAAGNNGTENNRQGNQVAYYSIMSEAKNAIAVGNYDDATGIINPSSSMGPTRDGRLKPDVVAPGTNIMAATLFSSAFRNAGEPHTYEELSGTSMAAPHVAGIATLMHQAHRDRIPACMGNHDLCPAYEYQALRNATIKAILVHTAQDLVYDENQAQLDQLLPNPDLTLGEGRPTFTFYGIGPDYSTGWGLVDGLLARRVVSEDRYREEFDLRQGEERRFLLEIPAVSDPFQRVTIAWDDAPAAAFTTGTSSLGFEEAKRLVNDIDMYLIDPLGRAHYPWRIPQPMAQGFPQPAGGQDNITIADIQGTQAVRSGLVAPPSLDFGYFDHENNVERVDVTNGPKGTWTLVVYGREISDTQNFSIAFNGLSLEPEEEIELVYRSRTFDVAGPIDRAVWREWRGGGDDHVAGSESDDAFLTGFVLDTRGPAAHALQLQARIKYLASGLESDWTDWADEGEELYGDPSHPFWPITQMEFRVVLPHIGTTFYDIEYQVLDEASGWSPWVCGATPVGDPGTAILAVQMRLKSSSTSPVCP